MECLINSEKYDIETVLNTVRHSLKGEAGLVAMRLGPGATLKTIIQKLDSIYGAIDHKETVLAKFYSAKHTSRLKRILNVQIFFWNKSLGIEHIVDSRTLLST